MTQRIFFVVVNRTPSKQQFRLRSGYRNSRRVSNMPTTSKPNVYLSRSPVLANPIILKFVNGGTKFQEFSETAFSIESTALRSDNVGNKALKSAYDSIKQAIDFFAAYVRNEMAAQMLRIPRSTLREIKQQRLLVAPTEVHWFSRNQNKLLDTLEDADRLLVLVDGAIARNLIDVAERARIESGVRRQLKDLLRCSLRAKKFLSSPFLP